MAKPADDLLHPCAGPIGDESNAAQSSPESARKTIFFKLLKLDQTLGILRTQALPLPSSGLAAHVPAAEGSSRLAP